MVTMLISMKVGGFQLELEGGQITILDVLPRDLLGS
jgi:hypothetical protein